MCSFAGCNKNYLLKSLLKICSHMFINSMPCMLLEGIPLQLLLVLNRDKKIRDHILDLVEYTSISMVYVVSVLSISYCESMVEINFAFIVSA